MCAVEANGFHGDVCLCACVVWLRTTSTSHIKSEDKYQASLCLISPNQPISASSVSVLIGGGDVICTPVGSANYASCCSTCV